MNNNYNHQHCARLDCFRCSAYKHSLGGSSSSKSCPGHVDNQLIFDMNQFLKSGLVNNALMGDLSNLDEAALLVNVYISKRLNAYDRRLYNVMALIYALYQENGKAETTTAQIHRLMKFTLSAPSIGQIQKIDHSLTRLNKTFVFVTIECKPLGSEEPITLNYSRKLLEFERWSEFDNEILAGSIVRILANPGLFSFVTERRQITSQADDEEENQ